VRDPVEVVRVWETMLGPESLRELHQAIQQPCSYLDLLRHFGELTERRSQAAALIDFIENRMAEVTRGLIGAPSRPRVYYAMGRPLFAIKGKRFENQLVRLAGGESVNQKLDLTGRPGMTIDRKTLIDLNPEVIIISSFLSNPVADFYDECLQRGIDVDAVRNRRIHTPPLPSSDFGGPRWVLGLLYLANMLHPDRFRFDLVREAELFYRQFHEIEFTNASLNRSFAKPASTWQWGSA
jgi:pyruvate formate lyase activating enzyme